MKSYRFLGEEAEVLGNRLDHARKCLAGAKTAWARNYWAQNVERLLFQWRQLPVLHDADAKITIIPRWTIAYDFYETSQGDFSGYDLLDKLIDSAFGRKTDLTPSWESHRAARLARAQF
jgi:hypothetical protein